MIHQAQIDPFGYCNAACWFCPVAYHDLPKETKRHMPLELFEKILDNIAEQRGKLVAPTFNGIYTAHFNEVLLYRHFEGMLRALRARKLGTVVLTNGTPLTPVKVDLIKEYGDVVWGVCCNVPAFEKYLWSRRSGIGADQFDILIANLHYADFIFRKQKGFLSVQVNGAEEQTTDKRGNRFPVTEYMELKRQADLANNMFPNTNVYKVSGLIDRAGLLPEEVFTNTMPAGRVVGCDNGAEVGGRPNGWLHVNAQGEAFLCCNDYHYEHKFGDFKTQRLEEFWNNRESVIKHAEETICTKCTQAKRI